MNREQLEMDLLGEKIAMHAAHLDAATHTLLTDLRTFDQKGGWYPGARSCVQWLTWRLGWDGRTAREHVRIANRLADLPLIDDALRRGEMSYAKVRAMTRVATTANEERLLDQARYSTGAQLEKICRLYAGVQRHDDDTKPGDDQERRRLTRRELDDGMVRIEGTFHPEEAAAIWSAIERVAAERCRTRDVRSTSGSAEPPCGDLSASSSDQRLDNLAGTPDENQDSGGDAPVVAAYLGSQSAQAEIPILRASIRQNGSAEPIKPNDRLPLAMRAAARAKDFDRATALVEIAHEVLRGSSRDRSPIDLVISVSAETLRANCRPLAVARHSGCPQSHGNPRASAVPSNPQDRTRDPASTGEPSPFRDAVASSGDVARAVAFGDGLENITAVALPEDDLDDITAVGVLGDGTCISATASRRLACDCGVTEVIEDERGTPLSIGRKRRTIPGSMKRALLRRDRTCRFPGCNTGVFLEGHHIEHWADGGKTEIGNMAALCSWHHRHVHEYGYTIEMDSNRQIRFRDPHGREIKDVPIRHVGPALGWPTIYACNAELGITAETPACLYTGDRVDYALCIDALVGVDDADN